MFMSRSKVEELEMQIKNLQERISNIESAIHMCHSENGDDKGENIYASLFMDNKIEINQVVEAICDKLKIKYHYGSKDRIK